MANKDTAMTQSTGSGSQTTVLNAFQRFFKNESSSAIPLFFATAVALAWANLSHASYEHIWHMELSLRLGQLSVTKSLAHWIDEALMALFFFTVGLEIKYEMLVGELASLRKAMLPVIGAVGGMVVPALVFTYFNHGLPTQRGWGIPMATDIAFALAVLAILSKRIPLGLKVFLSALAIADDLGAVMVIALFYTEQIMWGYLFAAAGFIALLILANRLWIHNPLVYAILGLGVWVAFLGSGCHATVAGVLVAAFIPARGKYETDDFIQEVNHQMNQFQCEPGSCGFSILLNSRHLDAVHAIEESCHDVETPLQRMEFGLHGWVTYVIIPLFALANAGLYLGDIQPMQALVHPVTLGVGLGLLLGKPVGIALFSLVGARMLKIDLPQNVSSRHIVGAGCLGGIGFTMSLFIGGLSFTDPQLISFTKLGILAASLLAAGAGTLVLFSGARQPS
jgi:NhaA family Na+:H+ antiporter